MKDVLAAKKPSRALLLAIATARLALREPGDDDFRSLLLDQEDELLRRARALRAADVDECAHERICALLDDAEYDAAAAARESESGLFLDVDAALRVLCEELRAEHESCKRLSPNASFVVAVDGSRQSYLAFEVAARLRRQGKLSIVNVDDSQSSSIQLPPLSSEFIREEYKAHCQRLKLPSKRFTVNVIPMADQILARQLLNFANRQRVDFLVVGSVGKGGPAIDQLGHVTRDALTATTSLPILVVSPAPVNATPLKQYVFVVAVDTSAAGHRCLLAALKLMRPVDQLRVVHFFYEPVVGQYDDRGMLDRFRELLLTINVDAAVDAVPMDEDVSVAEALQMYLTNHSAAYLVVGRQGDGALSGDELKSREASIGRVAAAMLRSPRCAVCLCP